MPKTHPTCTQPIYTTSQVLFGGINKTMTIYGTLVWVCLLALRSQINGCIVVFFSALFRLL